MLASAGFTRSYTLPPLSRLNQNEIETADLKFLGSERRWHFGNIYCYARHVRRRKRFDYGITSEF